MWWDWDLWRLPLWSFIGNVAQVLSLGAIIFAIYEVLARRRRVSSLNWAIDLASEEPGRNAKELLRVYDFGVVGMDDVRINWVAFVGCTYVPDWDRRLHWRVNAQRPQRVAITSPDFAKAWVMICSTTLTDRRFATFIWYPLENGGELGEEWHRQGIEYRKRVRLRWFLRFMPRHPDRLVGPGDDKWTLTRTMRLPSKRYRAAEERQAKALRELGAMVASPLSVGATQPDLPQPAPDPTS